jgi:hypothetical protein
VLPERAGTLGKIPAKYTGMCFFPGEAARTAASEQRRRGSMPGVGGKVGKSGCERDLPKVRVDSREYNMLLVEELVIPAATENRFWKLT